MKHVHAILNLDDVLEGLSVEIEGLLVDTIVNAKVIQHGTRMFEVQEIDIKSDARLSDKETGTYMGHINLNTTDNTFKDKFLNAVELIVLESARHVSEDLWDYKLVD